MKIEQQLYNGLIALGFRETNKPTALYRVFVPTEQSQFALPIKAAKLYLGTHGALRGSLDGKVTTSWSFSEAFRLRVLGAGRPAPKSIKIKNLVDII